MTTLRLRPLVLSLLLAASFSAAAQTEGGKAARFYEDALKRYERRDLNGAIIQLKNALQVDKNQLSVQLLLGKAMLGNGEAANAELAFNEALRLGVNRAEVVVPLAQALVAQGKQALVFEDKRLAVAGLPMAVQSQLLLVRGAASSDTGDTRSALKAIEDARNLAPGTPGPWLAEVPVRIRNRQFTEALVAVEQAIKLMPDSSDAIYLKGSILHVQGQPQPAKALYDQALKLDAGNVEARLARAGILADLGLNKEAQADIKELYLLAPFEPRAMYLKALLAERAGNAAASKAALKQITEMLDPVPIDFIRYRPQALMLNGMAHFGLNEFEKAKPYLEYALRQQPNSPLTKVMAQVVMTEPNFSRAVELLETYLNQRPGDGQALVMLATAHMSLGRHAKATTLMQEALRVKDAPEFRTALGISMIRGGQNINAIDELEKAFKADPKQSYAGLALVNLYLRNNQTAKAVAVADALVGSSPNNPSVLIVQALTKATMRDFDGARATYDKALKIDNRLLEAKLGLARIDLTTGAFETAKNRLGEVLKHEGRNVDALFEMAVLYEAWGKNEESLKWLDSAVEASGPRETRPNFALVAWHLRKGQAPKAMEAAKLLLGKLPEDVAALQTYARAQVANNDLAGARSTLTNASRRAAFEAPAQVEIAREQMQIRDLAGAAYSLDKALTAMPNLLPAQVLMATVELRQDDPARAEQRARQIIQSHPKLAVGYALLADIALSRGEAGPAIGALRRAHEAQPTSATLLRLFGTLQLQDPGNKPALDLAEAWLRRNPKDLPMLKALADAQARAGNYPVAKRSYEAVLKLRADDMEALNNLANVLIRQKDPGALKIAEQALAQSPQNALLLDTAGLANHIAGNKDRALALLRDARLREPDNPEIRYHLATVLAQAGRKTEAREELELAMRGNVTFDGIQDAKTLLTTLR